MAGPGPVRTGPGSVRDLLTALLGVPASSSLANPTTLVGTAVTQVFAANPTRVGFLVINLGSFNVFLAPDPAGPPSATNGILLQPNGGGLVSTWRDDGEVVSWDWEGIAIGGSSTVFKVPVTLEGGIGP